jgi:3-mercaptopyruvate sulfurtransferase SseA
VRPLRGGFDGWKEAGYPLEDYVADSPNNAGAKNVLPPSGSQALPLV